MTEDREIVFDEAGKGQTRGELGKDTTLHDEENPHFLLSVTDLSLVRQIADGRIDMVALAKCELEGRGFKLPS